MGKSVGDEVGGYRETHGIRREWSFQLASTCQALVGQTLEADRDQFAGAITTFGQSVPDPETAVELAFLRDRLFAVATRAGHHFHARFHREILPGDCKRSLIDESLPLWLPSKEDPRVLLQQWLSAYLNAFDATHQWPVAVRAAALLRRYFDQPLDINWIAHAVGAARTGVTRAFSERYGVSLGDYQTRVRVREGVRRLRDSQSTVAGVAEHVGYKSPKNFYRALRSLTGLTPAGVRNLSSDECSRLLEGPLELPRERGSKMTFG